MSSLIIVCWLCYSFLKEYSEDSNSEPDVDLENQYYNSKALKEEAPLEALKSFQKVLDLENGEKGEWGFKALKQMIKINFKLVSCLDNFYYFVLIFILFVSKITRKWWHDINSYWHTSKAQLLETTRKNLLILF